ncbi:MAG: leucine-rich repeat domain-containing protein [Planctomycetota bacterium]
MTEEHERSEPDVAEARRRIDAFDGGELNLAHLDLREVPELAGVQGLQSLVLSGNQLMTLDGLSSLEGLQSLDLSHNRLATLDIAALPDGLRSLELSANQLTTVNMAALPDVLGLLYLDDNQLTTVDVAALPRGLLVLDLSSNQLKTVDAASLPNRLRRLYVDNNQLTAIDVASLPKDLDSLHLRDNQLKTLEAASLPKGLEALDLNNNQLTTLDVASLPNGLRLLQLAGNQLATLDATSLPKDLKWLNLCNNQLIRLDVASLPVELEQLAVAGNAGLGLPPSLEYETDPRKLLAYLGQAEERLLDVKVAFIGEGRAGKTTLRKSLMEGGPPPDDLDRTKAFEVEDIRIRVQPPVGTDDEALPDEVGVRFRVYDFGGQRHLWNAHRLFLANRRTIYVVVADATRPPQENRLEHWVKYVEQVHERCLFADAYAEIEERRRQQPRSDTDWSDELQILIGELRRSRRRPPIVVVLTGCASQSLARSVPRGGRQPNEETMAVAERLRDETPDLSLVAYEAFDANVRDAGLDELREALGAASTQLDELWNERYPRSVRGMLDDFERTFGFDGADSEATPGDEPETAVMTCEDALGRIRSHAQAVSGDDKIEAEDYLRMIRDLGVLHWIGDRHDLRVDRARRDELKGQPARDVWNPRWIRVPIARTLWMEQGTRRDPVVDRSKLVDEIANALSGVEWSLSTADATLIPRSVDFLRMSDLIVPVSRHEYDDAFLIPDRIVDPKRPPEHPRWSASATITWRFDYLDPAVRTWLMGGLLEYRDPADDTLNTSLMKLRIDEVKAELYFIEQPGGSAGADMVIATYHGNKDIAHHAASKAAGIIERAFPKHLQSTLPEPERESFDQRAATVSDVPVGTSGDGARSFGVDERVDRQVDERVELWVSILKNVNPGVGERTQREFEAAVAKCLELSTRTRAKASKPVSAWQLACYDIVAPALLLRSVAGADGPGAVLRPERVNLGLVRDFIAEECLKGKSKRELANLVGPVWDELHAASGVSRRTQMWTLMQPSKGTTHHESACRAIASAAKSAIQKFAERYGDLQ